MIRILGTWNYNIAVLNMPAQNDLGRTLFVLFSQFCKYRFLQKCGISMSQRIPCLDHNIRFFKKFFQLFLLIV